MQCFLIVFQYFIAGTVSSIQSMSYSAFYSSDLASYLYV